MRRSSGIFTPGSKQCRRRNIRSRLTKRARRGLPVFVKNCASCHGTFGPGGRYQERLVAVEEVGTDAVRAHEFPVAFKRHLGASWVGEYGKTQLYPETNSYVAQPLDGIWANAPTCITAGANNVGFAAAARCSAGVLAVNRCGLRPKEARARNHSLS